MRPAVIQQFSLNVQYQIDSHTAVQAGYVGQTGQHLAVPLWVNQYTTDDTCAGLSSARLIRMLAIRTSSLSSHSSVTRIAPTIPAAMCSRRRYRGAFQITTLSRSPLQRHQSKGLEFLVNYTYGKSLTNNVGYFGVTGSGDSTIPTGRM
jgi:hypothetical protein